MQIDSNTMPLEAQPSNTSTISLTEFLNHVLPAEGAKCWFSARKKDGGTIQRRQHFCDTFEELEIGLRRDDAAKWNAYPACASFRTKNNRTHENALGAQSLWLDIDAGPGKPYPDADAAIAAVDAFCDKTDLPYPTVVYSGNGVHCWWTFEEMIPADMWMRVAKGFKHLTEIHGLQADPTRTADISSILRGPGTYNWKKPDAPLVVSCEQLMPRIKDLKAFCLKLSVSSPTVPPQLPPSTINIAADASNIYQNAEPSFAYKVVEQCCQMKHMRDTKGNIEEPLWYANLCVIAHCEDGEKVAHEWSCGHPSYSYEETEEKLSHARASSGPTTCKKFKSINPKGCEGCPFNVTSPILLGRESSQLMEAPPHIIALARELAVLSPVNYDLRRKEVAKEIGLRPPVLDDLVDSFRPKRDEDDTKKSGSALVLFIPEPWPEPVDGAALLDDVVAELLCYIILPEGAAEALALWIVHAYAFTAFSVTPRLTITSPEKRCGKTRVLEVLNELTPKPLLSANVTAAAMFRTIEAMRPTLLIDEADTFATDKNELRGIVNSGYMRNGQVVRTVGDDHEPRIFSTWCPTVFAAIGKLPDTIEDRSVIVPMRRRKTGEKIKPFRAGKVDSLKILARKAARWAKDNMDILSEAEPNMPEELHDRAADNWRPLIAIADAVGGAWPERGHRVALLLNGAGVQEDQSVKVQLLTDIREIFKALNVDKLPTTELLGRLHTMQDRQWNDWSYGKALSPRQLSSMLSAFGIKPKDVRIPDTYKPGQEKVLKGYELSQFTDAFSRYL